MEFNFNMTAQDYYAAWLEKDKKTNNKKKIKLALALMLAVELILAVIVETVLKKSFFLIAYILLIAFICIFKVAGKKKAVLNQFNDSAILQSMHTIRTYNDGLEILNSYEKMFVPWQSLYYAGENDTHFIILPTYAKGMLAIDKKRFASQELDHIKASIMNLTHSEGGRV